PKTNLYQSLHSTILPGKKQTIEIQIRTKEMHELAEKGISAHWKYKDPDPSNIVKEDARLHWLREMAELFKGQKNPKEFLKNLKVNLIPEEITVFTPKGQVITLPLGSSVLDFAFKIHTEIGLHCKHTKINGKNVPLKTILKSGDIVEIVTSSETVPSRNWLNMAFTSKARHHIKRWLNLQEKKKNIVLGKRLWGMKIKQHALPPEWLEKENFLNHLKQATNLKPKNMNEFYAMIGFGKIVLDKKFMNKISPPAKEEKKKRTKLKKVVKKVTKKRSLPLQVKDMKSSLVKLAKCCSPIKGEPIIGYITSGKGVTVHSLRCPLVSKEILDSKRMIEVAWDQSLEGSYKGKLIIVGKDIPGILANLTAVIAQLGGNITKADVATFSDNKTRIRVSLTIQDYKHLKNIIKKISGIKDIYKVKRI
ncbi:MAG: TGS domain-containing protein, partial [Candidatus Aminicenantaceae bacterium]